MYVIVSKIKRDLFFVALPVGTFWIMVLIGWVFGSNDSERKGFLVSIPRFIQTFNTRVGMPNLDTCIFVGAGQPRPRRLKRVLQQQGLPVPYKQSYSRLLIAS